MTKFIPTSRAQAEEEARKLMAYWAARGGIVHATVVATPIALDPSWKERERIAYSVRSDMVNGLPRAWAPGAERVAA